jgi:hypothetical protein
MPSDYHKLPIPPTVARYEVPLLAALNLTALLYVLNKLRQSHSVPRSIRIILYLSCFGFVLDVLFWLDYYVDFPLWFYGFLEFYPQVITSSMMERLGSQWNTSYKRHRGYVEGRPNYSKATQRVMLVSSLINNTGWFVWFSVGYALPIEHLRLWCRLYSMGGWWVYMSYTLYSARLLIRVIQDYVAPKYSRQIKCICICMVVAITSRTIMEACFITRNAKEINALSDKGLLWVNFVLYPIFALVAIGFSLVMSKSIVVKKQPQHSTKHLSYDNEMQSTSSGLTEKLKDSS